MNYKYCCNWGYAHRENPDSKWNESWVIHAVIDRRALKKTLKEGVALIDLFPTRLPYGIITAVRGTNLYQLASVCELCVQECANHTTYKRWVELTKEV